MEVIKMGYAKTQQGAIWRVTIKHELRRNGVTVRGDATNKELRDLMKAMKAEIK